MPKHNRNVPHEPFNQSKQDETDVKPMCGVNRSINQSEEKYVNKSNWLLFSCVLPEYVCLSVHKTYKKGCKIANV